MTAIRAELLVRTGTIEWRAYCVGQAGGWHLFVGHYGREVQAGIYPDGSEVGELAREGAKARFGPGVKPEIDTFDLIRDRGPESVIPVCFRAWHQTAPIRDCNRCPYRNQCYEGAAQP